MIDMDTGATEYISVKELAQRYGISMNRAYSTAKQLPHTLRFGATYRVWCGDLHLLEARHDREEEEQHG